MTSIYFSLAATTSILIVFPVFQERSSGGDPTSLPAFSRADVAVLPDGWWSTELSGGSWVSGREETNIGWPVSSLFDPCWQHRWSRQSSGDRGWRLWRRRWHLVDGGVCWVSHTRLARAWWASILVCFGGGGDGGGDPWKGGGVHASWGGDGFGLGWPCWASTLG